MTFVFFLFGLYLALGVLAMLPLVTERAGTSFFKMCAATAAFSIAAGGGLLWRRYGASGPAGVDALAATALTLVLVVLYNRSVHFGWARARPAFLALSILGGLAAVLLTAAPGPLGAASALSGILLLGSATTAMILGHYYLVVLDLPIAALRRMTLAIVVALAVRLLVVGVALVGPVHAGLAEARMVAEGLWSPDGVFVWMRLLFGIAGPLSLVWFIWKTVEIRSTQSATGILYVQLFLVLAGELLATYLRVAAGLTL